MNQKQNKLIKDIEKKCTTIMIGSIARFEQVFGYLWEDDSAQADRYYDMWQKTRHEVLNFGNHHIREVTENLYKYFLEENNKPQYSYEFRFKDKNNTTKETPE